MSSTRLYYTVFWVLCISLFTTDSFALHEAGGLKTKNFEQVQRIPDNILHVEKGEKIILVEKIPQRLTLIGYDDRFVKLMDLKCSTGKLPGKKKVSGDQKTPEGVYFITGRHLNKDLTPIYGTRALPLDYPNLLDKNSGRTGSAIWLHGTNKVLKDRDSNGCIALVNADIDSLERNISLERTPVIIAEKFNYVVPSDSSKTTESIRELIKGWKSALEKGTYHQLLSFYHGSYLPDISWWLEWSRLRKEFAGREGAFSVFTKALSIYKDADTYVAVFEQGVSAGDVHATAGIKKIYLTEENGTFKIKGDRYKTLHLGAEFRKANKNKAYPLNRCLATLDRKLTRKRAEELRRREEKKVRNMIDNWLAAWSSGNMDRYGDCYAATFRSGSMDKQAWIGRKQYLSHTYDYIDIKISEPNIILSPARNMVRFRQIYKSSGYSAEGTKSLILVKEEGEWKISNEIWNEN